MKVKDFDWRAGLADLFGGTVNQQTLEEAAESMVSVSVRDESYHYECLAMLSEGARAAAAGDSSVMASINRSGYQVSTNDAASKLLLDFRMIYLTEYDRQSRADGLV